MGINFHTRPSALISFPVRRRLSPGFSFGSSVRGPWKDVLKDNLTSGCLKHPFNLVEFPLMNCEPCLTDRFAGFFIRRFYQKFCRKYSGLVCQRYPARKRLHNILSQCSLNLRKVNLVHMLFRRKQFMGQLPVVRNEKKSLRINIQPAYGKQILSLCISNQEITVGCRLSSVAETTPCGLFSMKYSILA